MESPPTTPGVTDADPDRIEREMEQTRESITQKVAALETQVLGTIQTATTTLSETVQTVKETVTTAPAAVKETVEETVAAVKDSVKETISSVRESVASFSLSECTRNHPAAALGTSFATGLLTGYLLLGGRDRRPLMARGHDEPASGGRPGTAHAALETDHRGHAAPAPGMFDGLFGMIRGEVQQLARQALDTAFTALKRSVNERVPQAVDGAVQTLTARVTDAAGITDDRTTRPTAAPAVGF